MTAVLGSIAIYPIKALDPVAMESARISPRGILEHDRTYALRDAKGTFINGKREPRVHRLRSTFDPGFGEVSLRVEGDGAGAQFPLGERSKLNQWLSDYLGYPVQVEHESEAGFPDDTEAFGPTVVSEASLRAVAGWYPGLTLASVRGRFRTNLELSGAGLPAFWEDRLFGAPGERRPFQIGAVTLLAHNPCQRCVVPTRDPVSGEGWGGFQKEFMERRRQSLPSWANATRFNHYYRFAVNTSITPSEAGKTLHVGDPIAVPILEACQVS